MEQSYCGVSGVEIKKEENNNKKLINPKDFEYHSHDFGEMGKFIKLDYAANITNEKFKRWLNLWPVVYCVKDPNNNWMANGDKGFDDTHIALLANIEEILKTECKHDPYLLHDSHDSLGTVLCKYCGIKLQAHWSELK